MVKKMKGQKKVINMELQNYQVFIFMVYINIFLKESQEKEYYFMGLEKEGCDLREDDGEEIEKDSVMDR